MFFEDHRIQTIDVEIKNEGFSTDTVKGLELLNLFRE